MFTCGQQSSLLCYPWSSSLTLRALAQQPLSSFLTKALLTGMILAMVISFIAGSQVTASPSSPQATEGLQVARAQKGYQLLWHHCSTCYDSILLHWFDTIPQQAEEEAADLDWKSLASFLHLRLSLLVSSISSASMHSEP